MLSKCQILRRQLSVVGRTHRFVAKTNPAKADLGIEFQRMMQAKKKDHTWPSPEPESMFSSVAATELVFSKFGKAVLREYWPSVLAGKPGDIIVKESLATIWYVVNASEFGFLGVRVVVDKDREGKMALKMMIRKEDIEWCHIATAEVQAKDWLHLPTEPHLMRATSGPLGWRLRSKGVPLQVHAVKEGYPLTVQNMKNLIECLGGSHAGLKAKPEILTALLDLLGLSDDEKAAARRAQEGQQDLERDDEDDSVPGGLAV